MIGGGGDSDTDGLQDMTLVIKLRTFRNQRFHEWKGANWGKFSDGIRSDLSHNLSV